MNLRKLRSISAIAVLTCMFFECGGQLAPHAMAGIFGSRHMSACDCESCCEARLQQCKLREAGLRAQIDDLNQSLKACDERSKYLEEQLRLANDDRARLNGELCHVKDVLERTHSHLEYAERHLCELKVQLDQCHKEGEQAAADLREANKKIDKFEDENKELGRDLKTAEVAISKLESQVARYETWTWALALLAIALLLALFLILWHARHQAWVLNHDIEEARRQRDRDWQRMEELGNRYAAAKSRVIAFRREVENLQHTNMHLYSLKDEYKNGKSFAEQLAAVAEEKAFGTVREMAAHKKDCCCCKCTGGPAVVYGPGPVFGDKTQGGTTPLHGGNAPAPVGGGTPGATAAGGPAGPAAAGGPAGTAGAAGAAGAGGAAGTSGGAAGAPGGGSGGATAGPSGSAAGGAGGGAAAGPAGGGAAGPAGGAAGPGGAAPSPSNILPGLQGAPGGGGGGGDPLGGLLGLAGGVAALFG